MVINQYDLNFHPSGSGNHDSTIFLTSEPEVVNTVVPSLGEWPWL